MDVSCHLLRKNHSSAMPSHALYFDTETVEEKRETGSIHRMKLAWTCKAEYNKEGQIRSEQWMEWKTAAAMCRGIAQSCYEKTALWVFAHNAFFDLQAGGFFEWFTQHEWELQFIYENGLTYILVVRKGERTIKVVSTTNYFACSLQVLGQMVGLPKLDVSFEASAAEELSTYCHRDVEIVKLAMEQYFGFVRRHDLGAFSMTIPSQAMRAFRHRFMAEKIWIHKHEAVQKLEQECFFGGRTECFRIGKQDGGPFVTLDINSMYPHVMASESVPTQLVDFLDQPDSEWLKDALQEHCVISRCRLKTAEPIYAVHHNKRVCFPIGEFEAMLCTPGIREALKRGHLVSLGETAVYKRSVLFRRFVEELYALRMEYKEAGNEVWTYLVKILLNSLYGKWAQRKPLTEIEDRPETEGYRREEIEDLVTGKTFVVTQLMNRCFYTEGDEPGPGSFTAISAHITEAARILLWRLIEQAGRDCVLYCDTDSLKLRQTDVFRLQKLLDEKKLGALKVEKVSEDLNIFGLKAYCESGIWKIKGIPRKAVSLGNHVYSYEHFLKQASHLRKQQITGVISETLVKRLSLKYEKGVVTPDGRVLPFVFSLPVLPSTPQPSPSSGVPVSLLQ